jgi:hypothetical protein
MKKVLLPLSIVLVSMIGMNAQTKPAATPAATPAAAPATPPANPNGPSFKFESEEFDFGKLEQGQSVSHDFKFKNTGKEPMVINDATATCGCTKPTFAKEPIKPGATGVISVTFNSTGKMGAQDKAITITSNAKEGTKVIHLKGEVTPKPAEAAPATAPANSATPAPSVPK